MNVDIRISTNTHVAGQRTNTSREDGALLMPKV